MWARTLESFKPIAVGAIERVSYCKRKPRIDVAERHTNASIAFSETDGPKLARDQT